MNQTLTRLALIAAIAALPLGAGAGVTGTHGPDRGSGGSAAKPKPVAAEEQSTEQTAKPEEKKEVEVTKEAK